MAAPLFNVVRGGSLDLILARQTVVTVVCAVNMIAAIV
jgi:hypothetical protein